MANFQRNNQNVHGQALVATAGQVFELGLWGPLDTRSSPPTELNVSISPPTPSVSVTRGDMLPGQNVRIWRIAGLTPGSRVLVEAKEGGGAVWSSVTITGGMPAGAGVITREALRDKAGVVQAKYPPSPAIVALISLLTNGTNSALRAGVAMLESAGRSGILYEHTGGVALDIYRLKTDSTQRVQAHNLIRFFIANRNSLGWYNMFYESWGFSRSGLKGGQPDHDNHIHIDWMDFSTLKRDGGQFDRSQWTEITWPSESLTGAAIDTPANVSLVNAAWTNTSASVLTDADLPGLYNP